MFSFFPIILISYLFYLPIHLSEPCISGVSLVSFFPLVVCLICLRSFIFKICFSVLVILTSVLLELNFYFSYFSVAFSYSLALDPMCISLMSVYIFSDPFFGPFAGFLYFNFFISFPIPLMFSTFSFWILKFFFFIFSLVYFIILLVSHSDKAIMKQFQVPFH